MKALFSKSKAMISIAVVLCMVIALLPTGIFTLIGAADDTNVWDGTYEMFGGAGTKANPYQIGNVNQLMLLSHVSNQTTASVTVPVKGHTESTVTFTKSGYGWFATQYFVLTADIDLSGVENFAPIGGVNNGSNASTSVAFNSFDGQGHTVTGLTVNVAANANMISAGFFGQVAGNGVPVIKNLHVSGSVTANSFYVGGLLGSFMTAFNAGSVENCSFTGTVTSTKSAVPVGGLIGQVRNTGGYSKTVTVKNCHFNGNVTGYDTDQTGGLLGLLFPADSGQVTTLVLENCYTTGGTVQTGSNGVGALVGRSNGRTALTISNCWSDMVVEGTAGYVSGMVGYMASRTTSTNISNSHFAGQVASQVFLNSTLADGTDLTDLITLNNVYYKAGCTTDAAAGALTGAAEKSVSEFSDGTVRDLLNNGVPAGGLSWRNGKNGYPVHDIKPDVTGLTLSCGEIEFDPAVYSYTLSVPSSAATTTVTAVAATFTDLTVNGVSVASGKASAAIALSNERPTVITVIGDRDGVTVTYTITIVRAWSQTYEMFGGAGTKANPYQIGNVNQLMLLSHVSNQTTASVTVPVEGHTESTVTFTKSGYGWFASQYFVLTADIDLSGVDNFTPIGGFSTATTVAFNSFDGQGHTVTGMNVNVINNGAGQPTAAAGFFGQVAGNGVPVIKNLHVSGSVTAKSYYIGGIVGHFNPSFNGGSMENCSFTGTVRSTQSDVPVGGLIGQVRCVGDYSQTVSVTNCYFNGSVTGSGSDQTGGLLGLLFPSAKVGYVTTLVLEDCYTTGGTVQTGSNGVGGLVGRSNGRTALTISNCWSDMVVTGTAGYVSGMVGYMASTTTSTNISNSHFAGQVASQVFLNSALADGTDLTDLITLNKVYYKAGCTTDAATGALTGATQKSALEFADGTVAKELGAAKWATSATKKIPVLSDIGAATADAMVTLGTQIRTYTTKGMRFQFKMDTAAQVAELKEYGVVLAKGENVANGLLIDSAKSVKAVVYDGQTETLYKADVDGYDYFTALLTFNTTANYKTAYNARAYALYEDGNGQEIVVYSATIDGDNHPNTLFNVATEALKDENRPTPDYSEEELAYLNSIVNNG